MEQESLPTELISTETHRSLGKIKLNWIPQPGNYLEVEGRTYAVLERHHHYQYKIGGYCLKKVSLHVKTAQKPSEGSWVEGRWLIGDINCRYNARSEIFRCAVNPEGPCADCRFYEPIVEGN